MAERIGFIGLGRMGRWMALNVLKAGYDLTVNDIDAGAADFLTAQGAKAAATPAELAGRVDLTILSLPDTEIVREVLFGPTGLAEGLRADSAVIDCGTTGYQATLEFARRLTEQGAALGDAPVSGMEARAKEGQLTVMFGGEKGLFDRAGSILGVIGEKVLYMGGPGSGQLAKLINQLLFNISCAAIAEVLPMSAKLGLDPEKVVEVITTGTGRSFAAEFFAPLVLDGVFDQGYPLDAAYKDMVAAAEISARERIPLPLVQAAATTYQTALAEGYGRLGKGAMIKVFERLLGVEFRRRKTT